MRPFAYQRLQNVYRDAVARVGRTTPANPQLVFLAIDSASVNIEPQGDIEQLYGLTQDGSIEAHALKLMAHNFPWPREVYALILKRLLDAGAKTVLFDLTFPSSTEDDAPFRLALEKYRSRAVIGSNFVSSTENGSAGIGISLTRPPDTLIPQKEAMDDRVGFANFWPDQDDVVRRAQYRVTFEQLEEIPAMDHSQRFLSLAAKALIKSGHAAAVPPGLENRLFRFTAPPRKGFPPHSLFEIFVPEYWARNYRSGEFFRDKIIIVGAEGNWQHDEHQTPFGPMPGAELHLNAINAALHGEFIDETPARGVLALTALAGALAICASILFRSPWIRLVALAVLNVGGVAMALYFFNHRSVFLPMVAPGLEVNVTILLGLIFDFAWERVEKKRVRRTLERYVSRDIVREMLDHPQRYAESLGGAIKPATILFSDIRGYSKVTAQSDPHVLVSHLNEYLTAMVECVFRYGGTLDKFIGDAVMAVWGNVHTEGIQNDAVAAVRSALAMQEELKRLNKKWSASGWPELRIGIALNCGEVVAGNIGSPQRMEFTVIGDAVNVSWKLQELTKEVGSDLIVSETVAALVVEHFELRSLGKVVPRGVPDAVEIFGISKAIATPDDDVAATLAAK